MAARKPAVAARLEPKWHEPKWEPAVAARNPAVAARDPAVAARDLDLAFRYTSVLHNCGLGRGRLCGFFGAGSLCEDFETTALIILLTVFF